MATTDRSPESGFAATALRGLLRLGPIDLREADLALELGLSLWLRCCGTHLDLALETLLAARDALIDIAGMDPATEPVPLVGRSPRGDLVNLAGYLSLMVRRAAAASHVDPDALIDRTIEALSKAPRHVETARVAG